jgi:hypothetical protein
LPFITGCGSAKAPVASPPSARSVHGCEWETSALTAMILDVCTKVPVTQDVACGKRDDFGRAGNGEASKLTSGTITKANSMTVAQSSAIGRGQRFTHLFARITEEDDAYVVRVRLRNDAAPENTAWGEEIADSIESAAEMISILAERFSIPQERITLEIRMDEIAENTRH